MEQPASEADRTLGKLPVQGLGAPGTPNFLGVSDARPSLHNQLHNLGESLQEASFMNQMNQDQAESSCGAPAWKGHKSLRRSLSAPPPLRHFAFEEPRRQKLQKRVPPSPLHDVVAQLRAEVESLQKVVGQLAELSFGKRSPPAELSQEGDHQPNNNNNNNTNNTNNNNNDDNNDNNSSNKDSNNNNNHNIIIRESSLNSLDVEDEHSESSLEQDLDDQEQKRDSFGQKEPKNKKVTFNQDTLETCQEQNNRHQSSQLEQLEQRGKQNNNDKSPSKKQQQPATALKKKMEYKQCTDNNLGREEQSLGSLEAETQATTKHASRSPKHNHNTSNLGIGTKNTAAWGILIYTGAAISVAPVSFAPGVELSPLECTLQLRTITGRAIPALGRRTIQLVGEQLTFHVNFVIAEVEQALIGMDVFMMRQLSLQRSSNNEHHLVNSAGERTQLQLRGQHLYLEACSRRSGLSTCLGSNLPKPPGILLEDEDGDQDAASLEKIVDNQLRNQQGKNTANLGTTALPKQGATQQEKPSATIASPELLQETSLEQRGQTSASASLRTPLEKTRFMEQMELDAEKETSNLQEQEKKEISLRILLTLSLLNQWQIATTKASTACKEELLAEHLQELGLEQTKLDHHIFFGDELVVMTNSLDILIGESNCSRSCF